MADEPFALSTVTPAAPPDADYEALCAAVMATARGRWFLQEYARRNRHADTECLMAAIARIEGVVRTTQADLAGQGFRNNLLDMARTIAQARVEADTRTDTASDDRPGPEAGGTENICAVAERLQDCAWTMRERGLDMATCDQIETLARTLLAASALRDRSGERARRLAKALHDLEQRVKGMLDSGDTVLAAPAGTSGVDPAPAGLAKAALPNPGQPGPEDASNPAAPAWESPVASDCRAAAGPPQGPGVTEVPSPSGAQISQSPPAMVVPSVRHMPSPATMQMQSKSDLLSSEPAELPNSEPADFLLGPVPTKAEFNRSALAVIPGTHSPPNPTALITQQAQPSSSAPTTSPQPVPTLPVKLPATQPIPWPISPPADDALAALSTMSDEERIALFT